MYRLVTSVGVFLIYPTEIGWALKLGDDVSGNYESPIAAADDVYTHSTGFADWDFLEEDCPPDISEWEKVKYPTYPNTPAF